MTEPVLVVPSRPVPSATAAVLSLVEGDPLHQADRAEVEGAIRFTAATHDGLVDPNQVRELLPSWVFPRVIGPVYRGLTQLGVLEPDGWVINEDHKGRNSGRPARRYRLIG